RLAKAALALEPLSLERSKRLGGNLGRCLRPGGIDAVEPRRGPEALEGLARLGQQRLCVVAPPLRQQPLAVLELDDREVERELEVPQVRGRGGELAIRGRIGAGETCA